MKNISKYSQADIKAIRKSDDYILLVDQCSDIADELQVLTLKVVCLQAILLLNHYDLAKMLGYTEEEDYDNLLKQLKEKEDEISTFVELEVDNPARPRLIKVLNAISDLKDKEE